MALASSRVIRNDSLTRVCIDTNSLVIERDGVVAWIAVWAKNPFARQSQEALVVWRTELGRAVFNMRLSTATPTAASVRWPDRLRARRRGPMMAL